MAFYAGFTGLKFTYKELKQIISQMDKLENEGLKFTYKELKLFYCAFFK
ncbi:hypothetical protein Cst_c21430 [Thermoclostridium stercorarium subsp. stercorarium DSM 8532]|uniref:Uncharacterized protein n=1 Tax=Thermoclostridium stercorarium (strain ATCC 35414 / DSM 8532 / NCIMB 11754) TaxID=1121335 RepID=L7VR08_THES1|nr:hypothetical protein Cst_c21430 [Thermoclostridium stercorarium subsp. stercorarium DSM 8532]